jgi:hypothetical protein
MSIETLALPSRGIWAAGLLCLALGACRSTPPPAAAPAPTPPAVKTYGQPLAEAKPIPVATLVGKPDDFAGKPVTVEGTVRAACTNKGCWLELAESAKTCEGAPPGCRVTFKDYGFFIPTNSAGSRARVQGTFELATVSAPRVRHLEQEGAAFASKQPDGTARELRLVATGVELWRDR